MADRYACDSCRVMFDGRPRNQDQCPVCDHEGNIVEYANGTESRTDWYSSVWEGVTA